MYEELDTLVHEFETLLLLYEAGADVPRPLEQGTTPS